MSKLENLQPGDKVLVIGSGYGQSCTLGEVAKVGKIHISLIGSNAKYQVNGGYLVGRGRYSFAKIELFDEARWKKQETLNQREAVSNYPWDRCGEALVKAVYEMLPKP